MQNTRGQKKVHKQWIYMGKFSLLLSKRPPLYETKSLQIGRQISVTNPSMPKWRFTLCYSINCEKFQVESLRDAAFESDWVGTPIAFQRCLMFIMATANKGFQLTAGKFVPVSNLTLMNLGTINILYYFSVVNCPY